ncbi:MAG: hypothetical protein V7L27_02635 [Nostoc sp.]|uniref:hypothetical protein n=1 Tax=Nostoc sp. TaxID=1180 RepID=UPI002FF733BC
MAKAEGFLFAIALISCCDYSLHIEAAGEQGARERILQVLPNHACDAICRCNSLSTQKSAIKI